jgi:hypothetical protein
MQNLIQRAAQIEIHLSAGCIGKNKDHFVFTSVKTLLECRQKLDKRAGGNTTLAGKGGEVLFVTHEFIFTRILSVCQYYPGILWDLHLGQRKASSD